MRRLALVLAAALVLTACGPDHPEHRQVSYFKSAERNRVFVLELAEIADPARIRALAESQMHTDGQITAVYVFLPGMAPQGDPISARANIGDAFEFMEGTPYTWRYTIFPTGAVRFLRCRQTSEGPSCNDA